MAFIKKRSKLPFVLLTAFIIIVLVGAILGTLYYLFQAKIKELNAESEEKIQQLTFELYLLNREAYIPKDEIKLGTLLTPELFDKVNIKLETKQDLLLDESDMGKINTVTLPAGAAVLKSMTTETKPANDIREVELNMFLTQTNQKYGDHVDIRITFPNGESYIVLSKKQLKGINLKENTVWLWLDEAEILNISSAIIDAYIHQGSKLHVTTYILPELQEAAIPFYPANTDVLDLMKKDPNILKKAQDALAREARALLESHLSMINSEDIADVSSGVTEERAINQKIIDEMEVNVNAQENQESDTSEKDIGAGDSGFS